MYGTIHFFINYHNRQNSGILSIWCLANFVPFSQCITSETTMYICRLFCGISIYFVLSSVESNMHVVVMCSVFLCGHKIWQNKKMSTNKDFFCLVKMRISSFSFLSFLHWFLTPWNREHVMLRNNDIMHYMNQIVKGTIIFYIVQYSSL